MPTLEIQAFTPARVAEPERSVPRRLRGNHPHLDRPRLPPTAWPSPAAWGWRTWPSWRCWPGCGVPRIFVLDTGRLPQETYDLLQQVRRHYNLDVEVYFPQAAAVEALVRRDGPNGFYEGLDQRRACCAVRKVEPLHRALDGADAWITGLRREQAPTRRELQPFELDAEHGGILKINPLLDWTFDQTRAYLRHHGVPVNALHDQGYPSLGCAPCTRPVQPGEDLRAGRWWWEAPEHKECGLHLKTPIPEESHDRHAD